MVAPGFAPRSQQIRSRVLLQFLLKIAGFVVVLGIWRALIDKLLSLSLLITVAIVGLLLVPIVAALGRLWLDRQPTAAHAQRIALVIHYGIMLPLGAALICAIRAGIVLPLWELPVPQYISYTLLWIFGVFGMFTVLNLAIRARGAPFAIILSRRLATGWLYARTRNPMVLAFLLCLVATSLWLNSLSLLLWVVGTSLAMVAFLKVYEERELQLRFGQEYLEYKARTPMLIPRFRRSR